MSDHNWTIIFDGERFVPLPLVKASVRLKPMKRTHAEDLAVKFNADAVTADVARRFGREEVA